MDQLIELSDRDWPHESLRGMYYHRSCIGCGKEYIGPKREIFCFICESSKKRR
uniref:Toxin VapC6 domain, ZN ribbon domain n=1 Tax=Myoviridae sp. ctnjE18 TaxID=2827706 RepID=A0A8S5STN5_9CAUD|nr:MAG TPA: Putative toxin VapC6 domain, ZN ribbon domain [Myoviridae sp. ctnjE18]